MSAELVTHRILRRTTEEHHTERRTAKGELVGRDFTIHVRTCACGRVFRSFTDEGSEWHYLRHLGRPSKLMEGQRDE